MLSHAPHHKVSKTVLPWRSNLFLSGAVTTMHNIVKGPAYKRYVTLGFCSSKHGVIAAFITISFKAFLWPHLKPCARTSATLSTLTISMPLNFRCPFLCPSTTLVPVKKSSAAELGREAVDGNRSWTTVPSLQAHSLRVQQHHKSQRRVESAAPYHRW